MDVRCFCHGRPCWQGWANEEDFPDRSDVMAGLGRSTFRTILTVFQDNRFNPVRGILPLTVHPGFVQRWPAGSVALRAGSVDLDGWIWCPSLVSYRPRAVPGGGAALASARPRDVAPGTSPPGQSAVTAVACGLTACAVGLGI